MSKAMMGALALAVAAWGAQAQAAAPKMVAQAQAPGAAQAAQAADAGVAGATDPYEQRRALVARMQGKPQYLLGLFPGTVDQADLVFLMRRYLPLANMLSEVSDSLVSFLPEKKSDGIVDGTAKGRYELVYTNAESAVRAMQAGYRPLIKRNDPIQGVWLTRADSPLAKIEDLEGKRVGVIDRAMVTTLSRHTLEEKGLLSKVAYVDAGGAGQTGLFDSLKAKAVDAIVIRRNSAEKFMRENQGYKIVGESGTVPGFFLMASKAVPEETASRMAQAFLTLDGATPAGRQVLLGFDEGGQKASFSAAGSKDLEYMAAVLAAAAKRQGAPKPAAAPAAAPAPAASASQKAAN